MTDLGTAPARVPVYGIFTGTDAFMERQDAELYTMCRSAEEGRFR